MILASSAAVKSFSAKATGHMAPSSRFARSLKPSVAYLALNFCAHWKKQTTLPSLLAYAGIPYHVFGERDGAFSLMIAWIRFAMERSGSCIAAIASSARRSSSSLFAAAFLSLRVSFMAAISSGDNPLLLVVVRLADFFVSFFGL